MGNFLCKVYVKKLRANTISPNHCFSVYSNNMHVLYYRNVVNDEEVNNQYLVKEDTSNRKISCWVKKSTPKTVQRNMKLYNMVICQLYTSFKAYIPDQIHSQYCTKPTEEMLNDYKKMLREKKKKYTSKSVEKPKYI